jgi:nitrogen-specific signal transduction histidine kinase
VAAAHEINNPLTVVSGEVQLLARASSGVAESRIASMLEALERIRKVVARMSRINRLERADPVTSLPEMLDLKKSSDRPDRF